MMTEIERLKRREVALLQKNEAQIKTMKASFTEQAQQMIKTKDDEISRVRAEADAVAESAKKSVVRARQDASNARERAKRLQRTVDELRKELGLPMVKKKADKAISYPPNLLGDLSGDWWKS